MNTSEKPEAIPFITFNDRQGFVLSKEAEDFLAADLEVDGIDRAGPVAHPEVLEDLGEPGGLDDDLLRRLRTAECGLWIWGGGHG